MEDGLQDHGDRRVPFSAVYDDGFVRVGGALDFRIGRLCHRVLAIPKGAAKVRRFSFILGTDDNRGRGDCRRGDWQQDSELVGRSKGIAREPESMELSSIGPDHRRRIVGWNGGGGMDQEENRRPAENGGSFCSAADGGDGDRAARLFPWRADGSHLWIPNFPALGHRLRGRHRQTSNADLRISFSASSRNLDKTFKIDSASARRLVPHFSRFLPGFPFCRGFHQTRRKICGIDGHPMVLCYRYTYVLA